MLTHLFLRIKMNKLPTLIEHNDYMRGIADSELYDFDDITQETYEGYTLGCDRHIYLANGIKYKNMPRIESMDKFLIHEDVKNILALSSKFVLAGGSVTGMLRNDKFGDYDIFVISDEIDWDIIDAAVTYIKTAHPATKICIAKGLLQLTPNIQIILRSVPSIHSLIHGFDLPHCAFAYDGKRIYCTLLGIYCFVRQSILVVVEYNSSTFHKRINKYLDRDYNIILYRFPDSPPGTLIKYIILGDYIRLSIYNNNLITQKDIHYSGYTMGWNKHKSLLGEILVNAIRERPRWSTETTELYYAPTPIFTGYEIDPVAPFLHFKLRTFIEYTKEDRTVRKILASLNIAPYAGTKEDFRRLGFRYIFQISGGNWRVRHSRAFVLKALDYSTIQNLISEKIKLMDVLDSVFEEYQAALDQPALFWITENPSGQYTMSKHPITITAAEFYKVENRKH